MTRNWGWIYTENNWFYWKKSTKWKSFWRPFSKRTFFKSFSICP